MKKNMLALAFAVAVATGGAARAGVYVDQGWGYRMKVTFAGYAKPEALANFPVLVVLSNNVQNSGFAYSGFASPTDGADLRFADATEGVELNYEIEKWDQNGASHVWVQVPSLANASSYIYAYWGKGGVAAAPCTTNGATWTNGFVAVWHLSETSGSVHNDSAGVNNAVTNVGSVTYAPAGLIAGAWQFAGGSADYMRTADNAAELDSLPGLTVEGWCYATAASGVRAIVGKRNSGTADTSYAFFHNAGVLNADLGTSYRPAGPAVPSVNDWHYEAVTYAPGFAGSGFFVDGRLTNIATNQRTIGPQPYPVCLGRIAGNSGTWQGKLDEIRISRVARSTNWVWACWLNQASNAVFNAYGTAAATGQELPVTVVADAPSGVSRIAANLNGQLTSTGTAACAVSVYWGPSDGGTVSANWAHTNEFGTYVGALPHAYSTNVALPTADAIYYYRFFAANATTSAWSDARSFMAGSVWLDPATATAAERGPTSAVIRVCRDAALTNIAVTVNLTPGGTAVNGSDYQTVGSTIELGVGAASVPVVVTPIIDAVADDGEMATFTLAPGLYEIGTPGMATVTIADSGSVTSTWNNVGWADNQAIYSWTSTNYWSAGVPQCVRDVGIIPNGKKANVDADLGSAGNRPTVVCQAGGTLYKINNISATPIVLAGGTIDMNYRGSKVWTCPIHVAADSTLSGHTGDGDGAEFQGLLTGVSNATVTINNAVRWRFSDATAFQSNLRVTGLLYVDANSLGTGRLRLETGTAVGRWWPWGGFSLSITNAIQGHGAIGANNAPGSTATLGGPLDPGDETTNGTLTVHNANLALTSSAKLRVNLNGTNAYDRLVVDSGTVNLGNAALEVTHSPLYKPAAGDELFIVVNDGTDAITGTFAGLTNNALVDLGDGIKARINYFGNSEGGAVANDVRLFQFVLPPPPGTVLLIR